MPARAPSRTRPVDLVLHIGTGKTGTTSIQELLHRNRDRVAETGVLYPRSPGMTRHVRVSLSVLPDRVLERTPTWHEQGFASSADFRDHFQRELRAEIAEARLPRVILSDEGLYGVPDDSARDTLRAFTDRIAGTVRLIVYLRRQDDHLVSRYQQVVKVGEVRRLEQRARMDLSSTYDYHRRLVGWQRIMEPTQFVVRRFEPTRFSGGSLHQDFLDAAGVPVRADELEPATELNESLDAEAVEFLRILNLYRVKHEGARVGMINNREFVVRLRAASHADPGPTLTLPPVLLDEFMAKWETSNRAVARDFLGEDEGELFLAPRKSGTTTSTQLLEPARLGHYLELLEIPQPWHEPLRRITEREASTPR